LWTLCLPRRIGLDSYHKKLVKIVGEKTDKTHKPLGVR